MLLAVIAAILMLAAVSGSLGQVVVAFVAAVVAMGMQNSVLHAAADVPVGTMITGTLVRIG